VRILCLQHVRFEGPGEIATWAESRGHQLTCSHIYRAGFTHPTEHDFLIVMGGPMGVNDEQTYPFLAEEKAFIASVIDSGALVLGVCLGAQLLADVLGAPVTQADQPEIGWYPCERTTEGASSQVFGALPEQIAPLHWHGDTFAIPEGAIHGFASEACTNQAFDFDDGRVIGLQYHLEQTPETLAGLIEGAGDELADDLWIQSGEKMLAGGERFNVANDQLFTLLDAMATTRVSA
jgi:GMP synthase-like glutamine amidotransferase